MTTSDEPDLSLISDKTLLERSAKWAARHGRKRGEPQWAGIAKVFMLGSTFSNQLCKRFNIDPDDTSK